MPTLLTAVIFLKVLVDLNWVMKLTIEEIQKHFPSFEPDLVQDIVKVAEVKVCNEGEYILRKGIYIRSILIVFDGTVKVLRVNGNGSFFFMHYVQNGEALPLTMIYGNKQEASEVSAIAFKKTILLAIPLSCMDKWMAEYKSWYQFAFDTFRNRVKELLKTIDNIVFLNMNDRLMAYLKSHQQVVASKNIPLTRTQIAKDFHSSREVITRLLKQLDGKGKIKLHRNYIEIVNF